MVCTKSHSIYFSSTEHWDAFDHANSNVRIKEIHKSIQWLATTFKPLAVKREHATSLLRFFKPPRHRFTQSKLLYCNSSPQRQGQTLRCPPADAKSNVDRRHFKANFKLFDMFLRIFLVAVTWSSTVFWQIVCFKWYQHKYKGPSW